jgi:hypothetical protein
VALLLTDSTNFRTWNRNVQGQTLALAQVPGQDMLRDSNTGSLWTMDGLCVDGTLKGQRLQAVQSYQEFWHSWKNFHPNTRVY